MRPPFLIHITPGDDAPIYRQIVRQVVEGVASGVLDSGGRLPSLRALARKLVVAPLTVKKAYDALEKQGLIETRQGHGTFVRVDAVRSSQNASERLRPLARRLLLEADVGSVDAQALRVLLDEEREARSHDQLREVDPEALPRPAVPDGQTEVGAEVAADDLSRERVEALGRIPHPDPERVLGVEGGRGELGIERRLFLCQGPA